MEVAPSSMELGAMLVIYLVTVTHTFDTKLGLLP